MSAICPPMQNGQIISLQGRQVIPVQNIQVIPQIIPVQNVRPVNTVNVIGSIAEFFRGNKGSFIL